MPNHARNNKNAGDKRAAHADVADKRASLAGAANQRSPRTSATDQRSPRASAANKRAALADVAHKRSALVGSHGVAYDHSHQVGGTRYRAADGQWKDRDENTPAPYIPQTARINERPTLAQFVKQNAVYILSVAAVAIIAALLIFGIRMIGSSHLRAEVPNEAEYVNPYDWSCLVQNDGRFAYVVDGQVKSRLGIDVADYQEAIDWDAVAQDGIDFAIIRLGYRGATEGALYEDATFEENLVEARRVGLDCGIYFFSQAITEQEALEEADFVLEHLKGVPLQYPVAYDFEEVSSLGQTRTTNLSIEEQTAIADAFCSRIEEAGYDTVVYGNSYDLRSYDIDMLTGRQVWWAEYDVAYPSHYLDIAMWQFTSSGAVDGISTLVDMNLDLSAVLR